ncbi:hypothetical protein KQY27_00460 [Methanobrevibacter sp. TMH8]|uniref:hypothetical protein n=1 Tax=Methanobrevibacter sp. TMH8 TaxID=2848611 RepID=UPI001CCFA1A9|nr:hypothetical protein [Methanobrevibacter sp. TMH8]MBZ9570025.1 hypothetical protein [Methanobrevibacter sp. TMH8]
MHFIIISKKNNTFKINDKYLKSNNAPTLISKTFKKMEIKNFIVYCYNYTHIDHEKENYSFYCDKNRILLVNGLINVDNEIRDYDIVKFFNKLNDSSKLTGDYQLIKIDKNGNGFIKTPIFSIRQLFFYEDENCSVISTDPKLIVDGIEKFKEKKFVNHYDIKFIEDSIFNKLSVRKFPRNTIFKEIKRLFPNDKKKFINGNIVIDTNIKIEAPKSFKKKYKENKEKLYDEYYNDLINFTDKNLKYLKPQLNKIVLGLTGGFDSRLTLSIFSNLCKKNNIAFETFVNGNDDNGDVIIANKISKIVDVPHTQNKPPGGKHKSPKTINDYMLVFYIGKGDFDSNNFDSSRKYINDQHLLYINGMDAYKRHDMDSIYSGNRWFAKRYLQDKNFFFPLFYTENEIFFALETTKNNPEGYKEFIYEILKRSNPKLLEIPILGDNLPQTNIKPYLTKNLSNHEQEPFLWDYSFVRKNLKIILNENLNKKLGLKSKIIIKIIGLNELDFFLNKKIYKIINAYRKEKITLKLAIKKLIEEKSSQEYPKRKTMISMDGKNLKRKTIKNMRILMDYASVAKMKSFQEIEKELKI